MAFSVTGRPRTKGSLKVVTPRGRKPVLIEDHALSKPWRVKIVKAIKAQYPDIQPTSCAVEVRVSFWFERNGPSARILPWPTLNAGVNAAGDIDKLLRNLLDALQDADVILDDCQVVEVRSVKEWAPIDTPACMRVTVIRRSLP